MKKLLTILLLLICQQLSGNRAHIYLTPGMVDQDTAFYYYCQSVVDTVIVHRISGNNIVSWFVSPNIFHEDSLVVTTSGHYQYIETSPQYVINFSIYFVTVSPGESWLTSDTLKCTENALVLKGQATTYPDFTYNWNTGATTYQINALSPATYSVTITGACGVASDSVNVQNFPIPTVSLGPDISSCSGNVIVLSPGIYSNYLWNTNASTPTIEVTTSGMYSVIITDINGCKNKDTVQVDFIINHGQEIQLVTIDTISGNNKVLWETTDFNSTQESVRIYREVSTNVYESIGTAAYLGGQWIDDVSSENQSWRYKISIIDTCGNESPKSLFHQTINTSTVPRIPSGYMVIWTPYLIEGKENNVSNYYVFALNSLGNGWSPSQVAMVSGSVTSYNLPSVSDSLFVIGAEVTTGEKNIITTLALSNVVQNPLIMSIPSILSSKINIYPNPTTGVFTIIGTGEIAIYNLLGECISQTIIYGKNTYSLPIGIYMVKITTDQKNIVTKKVVVY